MSQATFHFWWINGRGEEGGGGTHADRFPYWSFTKTVIAICALKLQEAGSLDLDAPLQGARYTLRQLLNHTAGLPDYHSLLDYHRAVARDEEPWPREKLLERALAQGPVFAPGEGCTTPMSATCWPVITSRPSQARPSRVLSRT